MRAHAALGDVGQFHLLHVPVVSIVSPPLLHELFVEKARSFEKTLALRVAFYPLAGDGLFTSEGDLWRTQRKLMAPFFHPGAVKGYADAMNDVIPCQCQACEPALVAAASNRRMSSAPAGSDSSGKP